MVQCFCGMVHDLGRRGFLGALMAAAVDSAGAGAGVRRSRRSGADRGPRGGQPHPVRPGRGRWLRPCQRAPRQGPEPLPDVAQHGARAGDGGRHPGIRPRQHADRSARPRGLSRALHPWRDLQAAARRARDRAQPFAGGDPLCQRQGAAPADEPHRRLSRRRRAGVRNPRRRGSGIEHADQQSRRSAMHWRRRSGRIRWR